MRLASGSRTHHNWRQEIAQAGDAQRLAGAPEPAPKPAQTSPRSEEPTSSPGLDDVLPPGTAIVITGLQNATELNGRGAVVQSYSQRRARYAVKIASLQDKVVQLKPANAVPAPEGRLPRRSFEAFRDLVSAHTSVALESNANIGSLYRKFGDLHEDRDVVAALRAMEVSMERIQQGGAAAHGEGELWPVVKDREYMQNAVQTGVSAATSHTVQCSLADWKPH